jgi:hypothetical protein
VSRCITGPPWGTLPSRVSGAFSLEIKLPECEADHVYIVPTLRMYEAVPSLHHMSSWLGA